MSGTTNPGGQTAAPNQPAPGAEFTQSHVDAARSEGRQQGATAERERIQAVLAVGEGLPGHEKLLGVLAYDGKSTAADASLAVLQAEKTARAAAIAAHAADAPPAAKPSAAPADGQPTSARALASAALAISKTVKGA